MPDDPTILATSGGVTPGTRTMLEFGPLVHHAVDLSGAHGRRPRVMYVGTAIGDQEFHAHRMFEAARVAGFALTELRLFPMPNLEDIEPSMLEQDVIWVTGGSVANLLAVWRVHRLDEILRRVWQSGVVLAGVSAGSICWFQGGCTDSFGPELEPVTNGLGFLPYANGVHYDHEERRRPTIHRLVAEGTLGETLCTDDGVGLHFRGTELVEAVAECGGAAAYRVSIVDGAVDEQRLPTRRLG